MPARNPVATGIDSRSAIQPSRSGRVSTRITPVSSASAAAAEPYCGLPATAMLARVAAMIGAMVESAPTDAKRLRPKMAKAIVPAAKANRPD